MRCSSLHRRPQHWSPLFGRRVAVPPGRVRPGGGPAGRSPRPDEPVQGEREAGLPGGADIEGDVVAGDLGLDVCEPVELVAFAAGVVGLISHICARGWSVNSLAVRRVDIGKPGFCAS